MGIRGRLVPSAFFALALAGCGGCDDAPQNPAPKPGSDAAVSPTAPDASTNGDAGETDSGTTDVTAVITNETIQVGARTRSYVLSVPSNYDQARSYPLVFILHGDGGSGKQMRTATKFDQTTKGDAILAYPDGENQTWDLETPTASNKDIAFFEALTSALRTRFTLDDKRVFMWGWSNGAFFANQFACRKPGFLRAIAAQSGGAPYSTAQNPMGQYPNGYVKCVPDQSATPAIVFHGKKDGSVTFDSGQFSAEYWRYVNGCQATQTDVAPAPCKQFDGCPAGASVVFCGIDNMGHAIWSEAVSAGWAFFVRVSK